MSDQITPAETPAEKAMLNVDGKSYEVDSLPQEIKDCISIYQQWETELKAERLEVLKLEAALKGLQLEISNRLVSVDAQAAIDAAKTPVVEAIKLPAKSKPKKPSKI